MKLFAFAVLLLVAVSAVRFQVKDDDTGKICILLDVTARLTVSAKQDNVEFRNTFDVVELPQDNVTGSCGNSDTDTNATMTVNMGSFGSWTLVFLKEDRVLMDQTFVFIPGLLVNKTLPNDTTMTLNQTDDISLSSRNTSYLCNAQQTVLFDGQSFQGYLYSLTQEVSNLHVQAFGVVNDQYSQAEECSLDVTTQASIEPVTTPESSTTTETATTEAVITTQPPATTAESTTEVPNTSTTEPSTTQEPTTSTILQPPTLPNTYMVSDAGQTCIVFKAVISFSSFTYDVNGGGHTETGDIFIPYIDFPPGIDVNGSCGDASSDVQTMTILFHGNWTLTLTFERRNAEDRLRLGEAGEFSLRHIQLTYYLSTCFFPNALQPGQNQSAIRTNIKDYLTGQPDGSYKCDAETTLTLSNGVVFKTTDLQYKAFNTDTDVTFSTDNVSECPDDKDDKEGSNLIIYIAAGAGSGGLLIVIVAAVVIRRRCHRRQVYESLDGSVRYKGL